MINLDGRRFTVVSNSAGDAKPGETFFSFSQIGNALSVRYEGGDVAFGSIVGTVEGDILNLLFHQLTTKGEARGGTGRARVEILEDGRYQLLNDWVFTEGAEGGGHMVFEEVL